MIDASMIWPDIARYPLPFSQASKAANRSSMAPARVSCSRNSHTVLASGTASSNPSPRNRMNESRSWIWNSVAPSDSV